MKKSEHAPVKYESLSEAMSAAGFPPPQHPLITLINGLDKEWNLQPIHQPHVLSFYKISLRPHAGSCSVKYGQTYYDYNEGGLLFAAPNQVIGGAENEPGNNESRCLNQQITLLIHPDFLLNSPLAQKIKQYNYFSYSVNEALHLSAKEKEVIIALFRNIEDELNNRIDEISQDIIISQIDLLLSYAHRFYKRQFITRKQVNNSLLQNLEAILEDYFSGSRSLHQGTPTVQYLADQLHLSPSYLSDMLRSLTGQNTQQLIHEKLIEKAKEKLLTTDLSVSEIAYELGFEHPQSFSKLFKSKTAQTPMAFRSSFN
ncbi:AraC-type DNA-binding protein [Chitinophaga terrae (ex Kim and Jung 2007)]|jgi:AraC-like DNA-binding protein|uniref:AraC-type DNA-binding protein n=1 Tax=Chitinophaga terrae (ex Kim and Jung 2007) TaxID=408074 RepID=A0A1H4FEP4_9BACT|nr:response regulator transcription factor [Chitinophaga terrae (ex Kim and Jung 2007)]GEP92385.1 AraC family transcriptional regulator [Chitinophaga terrae (ex Kim and Jung 2007)]SEA95804.1 AraC-type DNA-binding protein [Chitinophaga terrae (ex Kim and Jung 2007)]